MRVTNVPQVLTVICNTLLLGFVGSATTSATALASSVMFPWSTFHIVNFCPISQSSKSNVCPLASAGAIDRHTVMHAACHVFCLMFIFFSCSLVVRYMQK